jgi:ribosome maturation factor RimP
MWVQQPTLNCRRAGYRGEADSYWFRSFQTEMAKAKIEICDRSLETGLLSCMEATAKIEAMISPALEGMGFDVVRVRFDGGKKPMLQIMAEPKDGKEMTVEHCADISRAVSAILDVEDPIPSAYELQVSSPGMDRPLVRLRDFEVYAGNVVKIELKMLLEGRKRFRGKLLGVADQTINLNMDGQDIALPFDQIAEAKIIITEELIAETMRKQAASSETEEKDVSQNA